MSGRYFPACGIKKSEEKGKGAGKPFFLSSSPAWKKKKHLFLSPFVGRKGRRKPHVSSFTLSGKTGIQEKGGKSCYHRDA